MKKLIALVLSLVMLFTLGLAFADGEGGEGGEGGTTPAAAATLPKANISITNMEKGDVVSLYKVIKWDAAAADWAFDGITVTGYADANALIADLKGANAPAAMTALTAAIAGKTPETTDVTIGDDKTYTYNAEVGSYLALVVGANGYVYNPMVLSVNFDYSTNPAGASVGTINADTAVTGTSIVAKKQPVTVDKEVEGTDKKNDVAVGDTIPFLVHTQTPNYGANYTNPSFVITDTLTTGLEMTADQQNAIKIIVDGTDPEVELEKGTDYTITTTKSGYTITFSKAYLLAAKANTAITVKYSATINENAITKPMHNVEQFDNDVNIVYSNSPTTNDGHDHDETHHYTFSIDASLLGSEGGSEVTKELVKIGYDAETDKVITSWETSDTTTWESINPLKGATFTLTGNGHTYTATSDANGYLNFEGLDAGTYELTETSAPAGYKFSTDPVSVVISAEYNNDGTLDSYEITIAGKYTSSYSATNEGGWTTKTTVDDDADTTGFINEKAVTLPSTGGIGTTIFYILGGLLVVGAAVILVARRRVKE